MLCIILTNLMLLTSMLFIFMKHPLSSGFMLLIQTITMSMNIGNLMPNFWYSYILFLIMIGGMLVLFIYMTSIASNEKFKFSMNLLILMISLILILMIINQYAHSILNLSSDSENQSSNNLLHLNMMKYMNYPNNNIFMMMIMYLFLTLIAIVKITYSNQGPLRQKF
uniref:NADH-ubiquinone oxidoreductase chain 6 n=1 Tax=Erotylinae sp. 2 ACP-2013 TaxID=1434613 RepID=A0A3G5FP39_9CUCU|nr:NADH dehydrogenase subunit 6 [Erotylinae sp. 2 ACP-2013]